MAIIKVIQIKSSARANQELATILKLSNNLRDKISSTEGEPSEVSELEKLSGRGKYSRLAYLYLATYWVEKK